MTMRRSSGEESITIFFKQKKFRVFIVQIELKQLRGALVFVVGSGAPSGRRRYDNHHLYFKYCVFVLKQRWGDAWMCPVSSQQQQQCCYYTSVLTATEWCADSQRGVKVQPASLPTPPSPMTTRSGMTLKRLQGPGPRSRRGTAVPGEKISVTQIMCEAE